jgi:hypothetical protein
MSKKHKDKKQAKPMQSIQTDPFGSYTGVPADPNEKPVQDADDL